MSQLAVFLKDNMGDTNLSVIKAWYLKNKKSMPIIGTAIFITLLWRYLYQLIYVPPKAFRHLHSINRVALFSSREMPNHKFEQLFVYPYVDKFNGLYTRFFSKDWTLLSVNPRYNKMFLSDPRTFVRDTNIFASAKGSLMNRFQGGTGLSTVTGAEYKQLKQTLQPSFNLPPPVETFGKVTNRSLDMLDKRGLIECDIADIIERMSLDAIGFAGFDHDFRSTIEEDNDWIHLYTDISQHTFSPFFFLFPIFDTKLRWLFPSRVRAHARLDRLIEKIDVLIEETQAKTKSKLIPDESETRKKFIHILVEAGLQGDERFTNTKIRELLLGIIFAGHDTTTSTIACAVTHLAKDKRVQEKARKEVIDVMGDIPDTLPTLEQLKEMTYVDAIIKETLRMHPPTKTGFRRNATKTIVLDECVIEKGVGVQVNVLGTHLHPDLWNNPMEFRPERVVEESTKFTGVNGVYYLPFGHGIHKCPGMNYSNMQQRVFLAILLSRYELSLSKGSLHTEYVITTGIADNIPTDLKLDLKRRF
ncbi:cytochrome P450 [Pilobolus umbonatus]|nr:cytochrome P450 [Pilobolus umbonatus]